MAERSLLAVAVERRGPVKGARVVAFLVAWQTARQALGDEWPELMSDQLVAYVGWWRVNERTGWRELARFHEVWPDQAPSELLDQVAGAWDARRGVQGLGAVTLA